jgi:hypothetical protein
LGEHHLDHVDLLNKLAEALPFTGRYSAVLPVYEQVAEIHRRVLGPTHPQTAMAQNRLSQRIAYEYGPGAALPLQEEMLASIEVNLGAGAPLAKIARRAMGLLRARADRAAQAGRPPGPTLSERREAALAALSSSTQDLLAGLEALDWHSLQHCYGPADDVPNLLRLLQAEDEGVRQDAYQELSNLLCHQGDVYQATSTAVPFMLRLIRAEGVPDKADLLALLQAIAAGPPCLTEHDTCMENVLAEEGRSFETEVEQARGYAQRAHDAVAEGLDTYQDLLDDPDPEVREWAFALLCILPEHSARAIPILLARLQSELDTDLKARLVEHLACGLADLLPDAGEEMVAERLNQLVGLGETAMVRFAAAVVLAHALGAKTPPSAVDVLQSAAAQPASLYLDAGLEGNDRAANETLVVEQARAALSRI